MGSIYFWRKNKWPRRPLDLQWIISTGITYLSAYHCTYRIRTFIHIVSKYVTSQMRRSDGYRDNIENAYGFFSMIFVVLGSHLPTIFIRFYFLIALIGFILQLGECYALFDWNLMCRTDAYRKREIGDEVWRIGLVV